MAHFAQIDSNNIVTQVLVIEQDVVNTGLFGEPSSFVQTSQSTNIAVSTTDYLTLNVTGNSGATDLRVDFQYIHDKYNMRIIL